VPNQHKPSRHMLNGTILYAHGQHIGGDEGRRRRLELSQAVSDAEPSRVATADAVSASPFLKWAGGKQWLAPRLVPLLRESPGRYFEPFLGGGATFFALQPGVSFLSDHNDELVNAYHVVRSDVEALIRVLGTFEHSKEFYYRSRATSPTTPLARAARFIYLNRAAWNGLYRVNRQGRFNVPMGRFAYEIDIVRADTLRNASSALRDATIRASDFENAVDPAEKGDAVYLDPPYAMAQDQCSFLRYNESKFSWKDQLRLSRVAKDLDAQGVTVVVSNAAHTTIGDLYKGFNILEIARPSLVSGKSYGRRRVKEYIVSNRPLSHLVPK